MYLKYQNLDGEEVIVTPEHVETALRIHDELSKASPSRRVNWGSHKLLMEQSGFHDSEVSENYRVFIRRNRESAGVLPTKEKYADMVVDEKIDVLKNLIGNIRHEKQLAQDDFRELSKLKREWSREIRLLDYVGEAMSGMSFEELFADFEPVNESSDVYMLAFLSDLHYGYEGENIVDFYGPDEAEYLLNQYADKLINMAQKEGASGIHVVNLGDLVEGMLRNDSYMQTTQNLVTQTVKATECVLKFLMKLCDHYPVLYEGIGGNHDRVTKNYKEAVEEDNLMLVSNAIIEQAAAKSNGRLTYRNPSNIYYTMIQANGKLILAVHGDRHKVFSDSIVAQQSVVYQKPIDAIVCGHFHTHYVREVSKDQYVAMFGTLKGTDSFSMKMGKTNSKSQGVILIRDGNLDIRQVKLG